MRLKLRAAKITLCAILLCGCSGAYVYAQTALSLTSSEQARIWHSLGKEATRTSVPAGLHVGEVVPGTMRLFRFDPNLRKRIPTLKPYSYVLLHGQVLIIDPRQEKIVSIVSK
jgi:hypothetical protein